jgi:hypothetical protein
MYELTAFATILRADGANIPEDSRNKDYREYLAWVAQGNAPKQYVAAPTLPAAPTDVELLRAEVEDLQLKYAAVDAKLKAAKI